MKVKFSELPTEVQTSIKLILYHRSEWMFNAKVAGGVIIAIGGLGIGNVATSKSLSESLCYATAFGFAEAGVGARVINEIKNHFPNYKAEYVDLFEKIKASLNTTPKLKELASKHPYLIVDKNGNLVGKKRLNIVMKWPLGRRRLVSPLQTEQKISFWRRSFPQRGEANSKNKTKKLLNSLRFWKK